jgi:formate dehydrogenase (coenzyme F420) beta subunit
MDLQQELRNEARRLLEAGEVAVVIGYEQGSTAFKTTPVFIDSADGVDKLVWNPACVNNLSSYLIQEAKDKKVAIVAKGCDVRSIVMTVQEHQVDRSNVHIIGVPCEGVIEPQALAAEGVRVDDIRGLTWEKGKIAVQMPTGNVTFDRNKVVKAACKTCGYPVPTQADTMIGGQVELAPSAASDFALPEALEARRQFWADQFDKCTRCYACRQACPGCFCKECFIDRITPRWAAKRSGASDAWMFHITRAMHQAGRCSQCGECTRVCPVGIPVHELAREIEGLVGDMFDYKAGIDFEADPVLGSFTPGDPDPNGHGG